MVGPQQCLLWAFGISKQAGPSSSTQPAPPNQSGSSPVRQPATPASGSGTQKKSQTPDARRKRRERKGTARVKKVKAAQRERSSTDAQKAEAREGAAQAATANGSVEQETHYTDERGRKRKRKKVRTRALASGEMGGSQRKWTPTERELVVVQHAKMAARAIGGKVANAAVATELQRLNPTIFGLGSPAKPNGIERQDVRSILLRHQKDTISDERGRPNALPECLRFMIILALTSVVNARATIVSAPMLHPVAIGVIMAAGYSTLLNDARRAHLQGLAKVGVTVV